MEADQFKDLLKRYQENSLSAEEKALVDQWYNDYDSDNFDGFKDDQQAARIKAGMQTAILAERPVKKLSIKWRSIYKYAAVVTLFASAWIFVFKKNRSISQESPILYTVFTTGAGESKILTLQDNSIVHLNPSSELKISTLFGTLSKRDVFLQKGNAFFEVAKDKRHPFFVHAQMVTTRVLGTKFKVSNQPDHTTEISVSEGKVQVSDKKGVLAILPRGKKLVFNQLTSQWKKTDFGISENNFWYKSVTNLNQATFSEVAKAIKINYGIELTTSAIHQINYRYNLQIRSERSLEETIKMICSVHENKYRRTKDGIVIY